MRTLKRESVRVRGSFAVWMYYGMWQVVAASNDGFYADCVNVENGEMGYIHVNDLPRGEARDLARALSEATR